MADTLRFILMILGGAQAVMMLVDEGVFHHRRGLGKFERWGHVADTSLFLAALCIPAFLTATHQNLVIYSVVSIASCLLITKDEWIHTEACEAVEQWCHAVLFVLHGAILVLIGSIWILEPNSWEIKAIPLAVFAWGLYQHIYWNIYYVRSRNK